MTVKSSISLTNAQDRFVRSLVKKGRYPSASAVLQQGVDLLRRKMEADEADEQALKTLLEERLAGSFITSKEALKRVETLIARKRNDVEG